MRIFAFLFLLIPCISFCQENGYVEYVWARNGLNLRDAPKKTGKRLATLPYGTKVTILDDGPDGPSDAVLIIPEVTTEDGEHNAPLYLKGTWVNVCTEQDTGFLFDGYLSTMKPLKDWSKDGFQLAGIDGVEHWILQSEHILDKRIGGFGNMNTSTVYSNHIVKYVNSGEGGGTVRFIFPLATNFNDGFLLLNLFLGFDFTKEKLVECSYTLTIRENFIFFESTGYNEFNYWHFLIQFDGHTLIIEEGMGC
jgi:hypothetical protein